MSYIFLFIIHIEENVFLRQHTGYSDNTYGELLKCRPKLCYQFSILLTVNQTNKALRSPLPSQADAYSAYTE